MNKRSVKKVLTTLHLIPNTALSQTLPSTNQQNPTMASRTEGTGQNIMAEESPGGDLSAPPDTAVIDPPGAALIAPPAVPAEAEEYILITPKMG